MRQAEPQQLPASPTFQFAPLLQAFALSPLISQCSIHPVSFSGYRGACLEKPSTPTCKKFPIPSICICSLSLPPFVLGRTQHTLSKLAVHPSKQFQLGQSLVCPRLALSSTSPQDHDPNLPVTPTASPCHLHGRQRCSLCCCPSSR